MLQWWTAIGLLLLAGLIPSAHADTMRCETGRVVSSGDSIDDVLDKCGEPTARRKDKRCRDLDSFDDQQTRKKQSPRASDCLAVEIWTYDFGPRRLKHKLTFSHGILRLIETGGYGK